MKKTLITVALMGLVASPALAGGLADPIMVMEPPQIVEAAEPSSSNAGLIIPLILIAILTVAVSSGGGGETILQ